MRERRYRVRWCVSVCACMVGRLCVSCSFYLIRLALKLLHIEWRALNYAMLWCMPSCSSSPFISLFLPFHLNFWLPLHPFVSLLSLFRSLSAFISFSHRPSIASLSPVASLFLPVCLCVCE